MKTYVSLGLTTSSIGTSYPPSRRRVAKRCSSRGEHRSIRASVVHGVTFSLCVCNFAESECNAAGETPLPLAPAPREKKRLGRPPMLRCSDVPMIRWRSYERRLQRKSLSLPLSFLLPCPPLGCNFFIFPLDTRTGIMIQCAPSREDSVFSSRRFCRYRYTKTKRKNK